MAAFVRLWEKRGYVLDEVVSFSQEAEKYRELEFNAALKIQSWYRGCKLRAKIRKLHKCALIIQRNFRGCVGRTKYSLRMKEALEERRQRYYDVMATKIQTCWRGYYVRKYVFDYYKYHQQMARMVATNEVMRTEATLFWQKAEEERLTTEEHRLEAQALEEARRLHFMLSTQSKDGVFRPLGKSLPIELQMTSLRFFLKRKSYKDTAKRLSTSSKIPQSSSADPSPSFGKNLEGPRILHSQPSKGNTGANRSRALPPLRPTASSQGPQGPFLPPEKLWKYHTRSLNPTLRVSTPYNSVEEARAELKAREWRERVVDEKFRPFSKRQIQYEPLIHTKTPFEKAAYGSVRFRDEEVSANVSPQPFRTLIHTSPYFSSDAY